MACFGNNLVGEVYDESGESRLFTRYFEKSCIFLFTFAKLFVL